MHRERSNAPYPMDFKIAAVRLLRESGKSLKTRGQTHQPRASPETREHDPHERATDTSNRYVPSERNEHPPKNREPTRAYCAAYLRQPLTDRPPLWPGHTNSEYL